MKPGPRPMPSNVRLITGNAGKRPENKEEPQLPIVIPDAPEGLGKDALLWWGYYCKILVGMRVLSEADAILLATLCEHTATYFYCMAIVHDKGRVVNLSKDKDKPYLGTNPFFTEAKYAEKRMHALLAEFGCSPSSRSRTKVL